MKKLANFIVEKKYFILAAVLLITVVCAFLIPHVHINQDMTAYLPDGSPVKEGLDIMEKEFPDNKIEGAIRVMFKGLTEDEIPDVLEKLRAVKDVYEVEYDGSEQYNKDGFTLFVVKCHYEFNTAGEKAVEAAIRDTFAGRNMVMQHTFSTLNEIPFWVYAIVLVVLITILFFMCASYVEPFLFLFTIGVAIVINLGTNIFFGSVAQTTYALSAVLQLALSMDYSIILMNRFRQEKEHEENSATAMKNAFRAALPSIIGSGMTTVIGLAMLVFMRFKIGLDLGRVMAKGVALSMLCVLTLLPALILIFEKAIVKTGKKELHIPTKYLAKFGYRARRVLAGVFLVLFIGSFCLQGITTITFAEPKSDKIEKHFPTNSNQIVVLYPTGEEQKLDELLGTLEGKEEVKLVMGYGNTLGKPLTVEEMKNAIKQMGNGVSVPPPMMPLLYYHYYSGEKPLLIPAGTFIEFLAEMMEDETFSSYFDEGTKEAIATIAPMANKTFLTTPKSPAEIGGILGMTAEQVTFLYAYYSALHPTAPLTMTLPELVSFLKTSVVGNPLFAGKITAEQAAQLETLSPFLDKDNISRPMTPAEISAAVGVDAATVNQVFLLKFGTAEGKTMTLYEFADYVCTDIIPHPTYGQFVPADLAAKVQLLKSVMDVTLGDVALSPADAAAFLSLAPADVNLLYHYRDVLQNPTAHYLSMQTFAGFMVDTVLKDETIGGSIDRDTASLLKAFRSVIDIVVSEKPLTPAEMTVLLRAATNKIDRNKTELIYLYYGSVHHFDQNWKLTIHEVAKHLKGKVLTDPRLAPLLNSHTKGVIEEVADQVESGVNGLKGPEHSLLLLDTKLPEEGKETTAFIKDLHQKLDEALEGKYYVVGHSPMNVEMEENFNRDLLLITLLTAIAIFVVVAFTFRSAGIPLILVLLVQCGVFITVVFNGLMGHTVYYLSLLVVQCILMGATIDYGIVFTNYYIEMRKTMDVKEALTAAFENSIHTILTSALIIIFITGIIGICPADPAITQICQTLSIGTISALLLILLVLPGLLSCFDRAVIRHSKKALAKKEQTKNEKSEE